MEVINFFYIYVIFNNVNMNIYLAIKYFKTYIHNNILCQLGWKINLSNKLLNNFFLYKIYIQ